MNCQWCGQHPATERIGDDDYQVCKKCKPKVKPYYQCVSCGKELSGTYGSFCRSRYERGTCGNDECTKAADIKYGMICCEKAEYTDCVCIRSYKCPVHGEVHIGTHD